jgi:hypothetical protein
MEGFGFEALADGAELDAWADEFCNVHEWRWNQTGTPSPYRDQAARDVMLEHLRAWSRDGVLRRFALRLDGQRHAFAACLAGNGRLLYYHVATSPSYSTLSLGRVLLRLIGIWASQNGFLTLDLGVGDEAYKYEFATRTDMLWKVHAAPRRAMALSVTTLKERVRKQPMAAKLWKRWVHGFVRGQVVPAAQRSRRAVHRLRTERRRTWNGLVRRRATDKTAIVWERRGQPALARADVRSLTTNEILQLTEPLSRHAPEERATLIERTYKGARAVALCRGEQPVMAVWLIAPRDSVPASVEQASWHLEPLMFGDAGLTRGALATLLSACSAMVPPSDRVTVTVPDHQALQHELTSAGFTAIQPVARDVHSADGTANKEHG